MIEELSLTETVVVPKKEEYLSQIRAIENAVLPTFFGVELMSRGETIQTGIWQSQWRFALLWAFGLQGFHDSALMKNPEVKHWKPVGEIFSSCFEICKATQNIRNAQSSTEVSSVSPYPSAFHQWKVILQEWNQHSFKLLGLYQGKREMENELAQTVSILRDCMKTGENPYDPIETPHSHCMIEMAIELGQHRAKDSVSMRKARKNFRDRVFRDYIDALQKWRRVLKTNPHIKAIHADGKHLVISKVGRI